ncbi:unnamed protein product [Rotaria magnacalcarata]|uniref:Uncharacterized protein n=1 Tax=Rotaria magnacalcarata TaxID=392030 RepID=A0A820EBE1_9BILA|nr:unnamed protein product [Rotaria magnacalcarata]CAF4244128.1 unnamed protein product [Rotaria magnacalcarata]CAF4245777.1 unnamed protein product [Rotaria magnacalcarata]
MSIDEIDNLKSRIGDLISINSFLSTSSRREVANFYIGHVSHTIKLERVLFEIDADPKVASIKPFADISQINQVTEEFEVLAMLGAIFRLKSITHGDDKV